jgi:hypothetical protein
VDGEKPAGWLPAKWHARVEAAVLVEAVEATLAGVRGDDDAKLRARTLLEPLVARGLLRRAGRFIEPLVIVKDEQLAGLRAWEALRGAYEAVGGCVRDIRHDVGTMSFTLLVCERCTAVFAPRRRAADARYCQSCAKSGRELAPPLGARGPETLGEKGSVVVRAPVARVGNVVLSLRNVTVSRCVECGELIHGRADKLVHSKSACSSRRQRRL